MKGFDITTIKNNGSIRKEINIFKFVYDTEVVKNLILERCQIIKGELPYNKVMGIGLKATKDTADLDISSIILSTNGVKEIISFESKLENKKYTANVIIRTNFNDIIEVNI